MARQVRLIGVPTDYGADRRGVDMGPSAIRYAGLAEQLAGAGVECADAGDLAVPRAEECDPDAGEPATGDAKFLSEIEEVCDRLAGEVAGAIDDGAFPIVLGGDHSIAMGTIRGTARDLDNLGIIWFDAHGDFNTPTTTPSGNVHGMPLAAVLGRGEFAGGNLHVPAVAEENVALVGLRDLDDPERDALRESDVTAFTMSDVDELGINDVVERALDVATDGADAIHASLDLDWLDPNEAPGVGTPVRGGVTYREAHAALESIAGRDADEGILRSLELVEVNPTLDQFNETAELATELAASAMGKRIL